MDYLSPFWWFRVGVLVMLIGWLVYRLYARRRAYLRQFERHAVSQEDAEKDRQQEAAAVVSALDRSRSGREESKERGRRGSAPEVHVLQERPKPAAAAPAAAPAPPAADQAPLQGEDLPPPVAGKCHVIVHNPDGTWLTLRHGKALSEVAMMGSKRTSFKAPRGPLTLTVTLVKEKETYRASFTGLREYCILTLKQGRIAQARTEKARLGFELLG